MVASEEKTYGLKAGEESIPDRPPITVSPSVHCSIPLSAFMVFGLLHAGAKRLRLSLHRELHSHGEYARVDEALEYS